MSSDTGRKCKLPTERTPNRARNPESAYHCAVPPYLSVSENTLVQAERDWLLWYLVHENNLWFWSFEISSHDVIMLTSALNSECIHLWIFMLFLNHRVLHASYIYHFTVKTTSRANLSTTTPIQIQADHSLKGSYIHPCHWTVSL